MFANGGGCAPQPHRFLLTPCRLAFTRASYHEQELVQAHRGYRPFQSHHACSLFANGGATSPEAIWTLSEPVTCVCKGGGALPPNPPAFFLRRAGLLSRTSHHQQDWLHAHNCYGAFQSHHAGSPFANCGATSAPTPALL